MIKPKKRPSADQSDVDSKPKSQKLNPGGENPVNEGTVCVICSKYIVIGVPKVIMVP